MKKILFIFLFGITAIANSFSQENDPYDFVKGTEIIFADNFKNDRIDTFPSKWQLYNNHLVKTFGNGKFQCFKVAETNKEKFFFLQCKSDFTPSYPINLTDSSAIEFDFYLYPEASFNLNFEFPISNKNAHEDSWAISVNEGNFIELTSYLNGIYNNEHRDFNHKINANEWHHLIVRSFKNNIDIYLDNFKIPSIKNCKCRGTDSAILHITNNKEICYANFIFEKNFNSINFNQLKSHNSITTRSIDFKNNKPALSAVGINYINSFCKWYKNNQDLKLEIDIYTHWPEEPEKAQKLTNKRADYLRNFINQHGINTDHLVIIGKGNSENTNEQDNFLQHLYQLKTEIKSLD